MGILKVLAFNNDRTVRETVVSSVLYVSEIRKSLALFGGRATMSDSDENGNSYHPNGKFNEPVYRVRISEPNVQPEQDIFCNNGDL